MTIGLKWIIDTAIQKPQKLIGLVTNDDGSPVSPIQLYNLAIEARAKGYRVLPVCDNIDERGYCQGHEINEDGTDK